MLLIDPIDDDVATLFRLATSLLLLLAGASDGLATVSGSWGDFRFMEVIIRCKPSVSPRLSYRSQVVTQYRAWCGPGMPT